MQTWHKSQKSVKVWHLGITKQRVLKVFLLLVFFSKNPSVYPWSTILTPCPPKYIYWLLLIRMLTLEHSVGEPQGKWEWEYKESFWWEHVAWLVASPVCRLEQVRLSSQVVISATSLGAFIFIRARELDKQIANALTVVLNMLPRMNLRCHGEVLCGKFEYISQLQRPHFNPSGQGLGRVCSLGAILQTMPCHIFSVSGCHSTTVIFSLLLLASFCSVHSFKIFPVLQFQDCSPPIGSPDWLEQIEAVAQKRWKGAPGQTPSNK